MGLTYLAIIDPIGLGTVTVLMITMIIKSFKSFKSFLHHADGQVGLRPGIPDPLIVQ